MIAADYENGSRWLVHIFFHNQSAFSLVVASAMILDSIVYLAKVVCFLDFQETTPPFLFKI